MSEHVSELPDTATGEGRPRSFAASNLLNPDMPSVINEHIPSTVRPLSTPPSASPLALTAAHWPLPPRSCMPP